MCSLRGKLNAEGDTDVYIAQQKDRKNIQEQKLYFKSNFRVCDALKLTYYQNFTVFIMHALITW